ncbi:hypothetical protein [Yersinia pekkanenii]|nr:hypothetical protein [Yersinia pekkanenii]
MAKGWYRDKGKHDRDAMVFYTFPAAFEQVDEAISVSHRALMAVRSMST